MSTQQERAAARRQEKLDQIEEQKKGGPLVERGDLGRAQGEPAAGRRSRSGRLAATQELLLRTVRR